MILASDWSRRTPAVLTLAVLFVLAAGGSRSWAEGTTVPAQSTAAPAQSTVPPAAPPVTTVNPAPVSYKDAQYVQVTLGDPNQEMGVRLIDGQPDGGTQPVTDGSGRMSAPVVAGDRFFYFDIHDTYIHGGKNAVVMTVAYKDTGLAPVYLEYDSYDPYRPESMADDVVKKRMPLVVRSNSDEIRTARITLEDARFRNSLPGGADFRIGSSDDLTITNVSVMLLSHAEATPAIRVLLDGKPVTFDPNDVQPFIHPVTGRTLVPFRAMFHALGISDADILWNGDLRRVDAKKGQTTIRLTIDSDLAFVNAVPVRLDQSATIIGSRTVVPLRFVSEQFGLDVGWDAVNRMITLTTRPVQPTQPGTAQTTQPGTAQPTQPGTTQPTQP